MLEFMKQHWIMFVIGGAIFIGAIAMVIYGVITKGGWKDYGLMERHGNKLKWPISMFPITVHFSNDLSLIWVEVYRKVIVNFNRSADRELFDLGSQVPSDFDVGSFPPSGMVYLRTSVYATDQDVCDTTNDGGAVTQHKYDKETGDILSAVVTLPDPYISSYTHAILTHELGHVLGLDHDEHKSSIMYPVMHGRPQTLSDSDKRLLKKIYGKKAKVS